MSAMDAFKYGRAGKPIPTPAVPKNLCGACADLGTDPFPMSQKTFYCWGLMTWRSTDAAACERFTASPTPHEVRRS